VLERGQEDALDVVGRDVGAPGRRRHGLRGHLQEQHRPSPEPEGAGGLGTFDIFEMDQEPTGIATHDSAFGDYDDDGDPDLLNANDNENAKLWRNQRNVLPGPLANPADYFVDVTISAGIFAAYCAHAAFVDLNNDTHVDIHLDGFGESGIYRNNGNLTFTGFPGVGLYSAAYADMNGDTLLDIAAAAQSRGMVFLNCTNASGALTFQEAQGALPGVGDPTWDPPTYGVALGDLDRDGDFDIIFGNGDGGQQYRNLVFLNQVVPNPQPP
jgi:hypothetical protein